MNNETDFKEVFCRSVDRQGGHTFKIAMSLISGLPDLYCALPGFVPLLLEAKYIKDLPTNGKFSRKIKYRPLQRPNLVACNKVYKASRENVAFCLLGLELDDGKRFCTLWDPEIEIVTHEDLWNENFQFIEIKNYGKKWFINVGLLFLNLKVPTLGVYNPDHEIVNSAISTDVVI